MTNEELWQSAMGEIELSISRANFITWFKNTKILSNDSGKIVIGVPNGFAKEWLENKYNSYILKALRNAQENIQEITCLIYNPQEIGVPDGHKSVDAVKNPLNSPKKTIGTPFSSRPLTTIDPVVAAQDANLNHRYTFDGFIIGENNELARAACFAVSQNLGRIYNPLFIYGGVGLGKTHLLQSIGNEVLRLDSNKKVRYMTLEKFANELIESIKNQTIAQFKVEYQKIDLLIIDDIQFLSGKEKTQNEFFHIFNALYQINKQIVISSDRPPKEIATLEDRLQSRFEGGMIADIGRPDLETRMAILKVKSFEKGFPLEDPEVIRFIAENIKNNIRELEGALNKVIASSQIENKPITVDFVKKALGDIISSGKRKGVHFKHIIDVVSKFYNISQDELMTKGRKQEVAKARQIAMYLMRTELSASYPGIGAQFGGRDHTTALHAFEKIQKEQAIDEKLREDLSALVEKIYQA
jgi:chromosomal replication initiator protein